MNIDIKEHGGTFGGGKGSPDYILKMEGVSNVTSKTSLVQTHGGRYAVAFSKSFIVTSSGSTTQPSVFVKDRKTNKTIMSFSAYNSVSSCYIQGANRGIIVGDRYLIYGVTNGANVVVKKDLLNGGAETTLPTYDTFVHSWVSEEGYGYMCAYGRVVKYDKNGNEVWNCSTSIPNGYYYIYGEYDGKVFVGTASYCNAINATTGVREQQSTTSWGFPVIGFINSKNGLIYTVGTDEVLRVHQINGASVGTSTQTRSYVSFVLPTSKEINELFVGYSLSSSLQTYDRGVLNVISPNSINSTPLEYNVFGSNAHANGRQILCNTERLEIMHDGASFYYNTSSVVNMTFLTKVGKYKL